jgi:membrane-associated protease RseP (regulator of RpoE activity)
MKIAKCKMRNRGRIGCLALKILAVGGLLLLGAATASAQQAFSAGDLREVRPSLINDLDLTPPKYWLGVECLALPAPLREQLQLPEKQGLLVVAVVPESPAAKAGIARHDILWSVDGKPLTAARDLIQAVERVKSGKLAVEVIHAGKRKTVDAAPTRRPEGSSPQAPPAVADWNTIQKWIEQQWAENNDAGPLHFRILHSGAILPPMPPMPDNMSVTVSKQGDQPAKITVKRGEQEWETTENQLQKLPDDVRPYVNRMLGRGALGLAGVERALERAAESAAHKPPAAGKGASGPSFEDRVEQQLEALNRRIDKIMQSLEKPPQK